MRSYTHEIIFQYVCECQLIYDTVSMNEIKTNFCHESEINTEKRDKMVSGDKKKIHIIKSASNENVYVKIILMGVVLWWWLLFLSYNLSACKMYILYLFIIVNKNWHAMPYQWRLYTAMICLIRLCFSSKQLHLINEHLKHHKTHFIIMTFWVYL